MQIAAPNLQAAPRGVAMPDQVGRVANVQPVAAIAVVPVAAAAAPVPGVVALNDVGTDRLLLRSPMFVTLPVFPGVALPIQAAAPVGERVVGQLARLGSPLGEIVPFDVGALERGMEQFLQQFERIVAAPTSSYAVPAWLVTAAAALVAWEVARRQLRAREREDLFAPALGDPASPWPAGWSGPSAEDRP